MAQGRWETLRVLYYAAGLGLVMRIMRIVIYYCMIVILTYVPFCSLLSLSFLHPSIQPSQPVLWIPLLL